MRDVVDDSAVRDRDSQVDDLQSIGGTRGRNGWRFTGREGGFVQGSGEPAATPWSSSDRTEGVPGPDASGTARAAGLYGGGRLQEAIEDFAGNQTRFVVVGRGISERTGRDKTSLALFMKKDKPGALLMILSEFAYGQINLTKIQSRPTKRQLGDYMFFVDLEGHVDDPAVALALECLRLKLREVKVIGSYPRVG